MKHNHCTACTTRMERWGTTAAGTPRYHCAACKRTSIIHRPDTRVRHHRDRFIAWLTGVASKQDIAKRYHVTRRTLTTEFTRFFGETLTPEIPQGFRATILIVDGKFIHGSTLCTLVAVDEHDRIFWEFALSEEYRTWYAFLIRFAPPTVVVADGHKGMALFVKRWWPHTAFQRCHFHMVQLVIQYVSRTPNTMAGRDILHLCYRLKTITTKTEREQWIMLHRIWEHQYAAVFAEKTETGAYRYRKLRSVRLIMRRAVPDLFTFLDYPGCPNTTNLVEGWVNTAIAEGLRRHRGLHLSQKKTLVSIILSNLHRKPKEKPTRKFP